MVTVGVKVALKHTKHPPMEPEAKAICPFLHWQADKGVKIYTWINLSWNSQSFVRIHIQLYWKWLVCVPLQTYQSWRRPNRFQRTTQIKLPGSKIYRIVQLFAYWMRHIFKFIKSQTLKHDRYLGHVNLIAPRWGGLQYLNSLEQILLHL